MPMPMQYARASQEFDALVEQLRVRLGHDTRHQTYQTVESVLRVFRRRLSIRQALAFADVLPAVLRAVFVSDWDIDEPIRPFTDRAASTAEVKAFRADHDFSPDDALEEFATVLRRHVDPLAFETVLARLPDGASLFWATS